MSIGRKVIWRREVMSVRRWFNKYKEFISQEDQEIFENAIALFLRKNKQDPETYFDVQSVMTYEENKLLDRYNESFLWHEKKILSVSAGAPIVMIAFADFVLFVRTLI